MQTTAISNQETAMAKVTTCHLAMSDRHSKTQRLRNRLNWLRHRHLYFLALSIFLMVLFFYNVALGLAPSFSLSVDASTSTTLLTVEGILLALSPEVKARVVRTYAIGLALASLLYSVFCTMVLSYYQTQNLIPASTISLGPI